MNVDQIEYIFIEFSIIGTIGSVVFTIMKVKLNIIGKFQNLGLM